MLLIINTGKRKLGTGKNVTKTLSLIVQNNDASSLVKSESKLDTTEQVTNNFAVKTQFMEICKSPMQIAYSCNQVSILCSNL